MLVEGLGDIPSWTLVLVVLYLTDISIPHPRLSARLI